LSFAAGVRGPLQSRYCASAHSHSDRELESTRIAKALEADPKLLEEVVARMTGEQRRRFTVAGGAYEWFGKEKISSELDSADQDKDRLISPRDFNHWFENALRRHNDMKQKGETSGTTGARSSAKVPLAALCLIACETGLPFVGFGFLDNATMIVAGDAIDKSVGFYLNCSVMASAAMGNVVSGIMGMQVHGGVEKVVQRLGLPVPALTPEQQKSQRVFFAGHFGGTIGIALGLSLGMLPLMWISPDDDDHMYRKAFNSLDVDCNGKIDAAELKKGLQGIGVRVESLDVENVLRKHSATGQTAVDFHEFCAICEQLIKSQKAAQVKAN
jgi:hypothetical protein